MEKPYLFDLAISFVEEDSPIAKSLYKYFKNKFKVFNYKNYQNLLGGKDGTVVLNKVFGQDSRLVLILFRPVWGTTPFTRDEMEAIRDRSRNSGFEFCIMAPVVECEIPTWFPKYRIWLNYPTLKLNGLKSIIEQRIIDTGLDYRDETTEELFTRISEEIKFEQIKHQLLSSEKGVKIAESEYDNLHNYLKIKLDSINKIDSNIKIETLSISNNYYYIELYGWRLNFNWNKKFTNTVQKTEFGQSLLSIRLYSNDKISEKVEYEFDIPYKETYAWKKLYSDEFYNSKILVDLWLKKLISKIAPNSYNN